MRVPPDIGEQRRRWLPSRSNAIRFLIAAAISAIAVFFAIGIRYNEPPWMQDRNLVLFGVAMAAAVVVALALESNRLLAAEGHIRRFVRVVAIASITCLPVLVLVKVADFEIRQLTYLIEIVLVFFFVFLFGIGLPRWISFAIGAIVLLITVQSSFTEVGRATFAQMIRGVAPGEVRAASSRLVFSGLEDLRVSEYPIVPDQAERGADPGGALALLDGNRLLLIDANGRFYRIEVDGDLVASTRLARIESPMNRSDYESSTRNPSQFFRITDTLLVSGAESGQQRIFVAHHQWNRADDCVTLNVDEGELDIEALDAPISWTTRFESFPCVPTSAGLTNETGGRMALLSPDSLLLTMGITIDTTSSQDLSSSYGKILELDTRTWESRIFSIGHRNPQGLLVDGNTIWSTEHGPDGGDELNIIQEGGNYGWPSSTYGLAYGKREAYGRQELGNTSMPGEHVEDIKPLYAWVPSIGVSRLIRLNGNGFALWQDDLLVGSLSGNGNGRSLYRIRIRDDVIRTVERIVVDYKVRDMAQLSDGSIVSWDGTRHVQVLTPVSHIFSACTSCHAVNQGFVSNGIGPDLFGIVGSSVGTVPQYTYSTAMTEVGGRWSEERLHRFLENPQAFSPGTTMNIPGMEDRNERQQIIDYLKEFNRR